MQANIMLNNHISIELKLMKILAIGNSQSIPPITSHKVPQKDLDQDPPTASTLFCLQHLSLFLR